MSTPEDSRVETTQIVMPSHVNGTGTMLFGGVVVQWIDVCAGVAAMRHAKGAVVTASIDRLDFIHPVRLGDVVVLRAQVNYASRTSMEVGCRVEVEDPKTGERRYVCKAYLTFVGVDEHTRPRNIPPLVLETDHDLRRAERAAERRAARLKAAGR